MHGKVAIVTGAGNGIGAATAQRLADAGAAVLVSDLEVDSAIRTVDLVCERGGIAHPEVGDVRDSKYVQRVVEVAVDRFGRLDTMVTCAGVFPHDPLLELSLERWIDVLDVNLTGTFLCAQAAAQALVAQGEGGSIVTVSSRAADQPPAGLAHYAASKGGVSSLTRGLAHELGPHGIRANAVQPGPITDTRAARRTLERAAADAGTTPEDLSASMLAGLPLGRAGTAADVALAILFLASPASAYVTGSVLRIDGGRMLV